MIERFVGLDTLATAVIVINGAKRIVYANSAAEDLLKSSRRALLDQFLPGLFVESTAFRALIDSAVADPFDVKRQLLDLQLVQRHQLGVHVTASTPDATGALIVLEIREIEQQLRVDRETRMLDQSHANRELIRNLAHEIKNPLGGIRGAAQLLEGELPAPELKEYTQVIINESDRLQTLVDRLLAPHRKPHVVSMMNIHEVCERVRSVILAEYPNGLLVHRDYDTSIPEFEGDFEQIIQVVLNIVRNAAEALAPQIQNGTAEIKICTRVVRQSTLNLKLHRLALEVQVIDNGPGVPPDIREKIFFPLVSGRDGGSGLGLTLAQTFIQQHNGMIECESKPNRTVFKVLLPLSVA